MGNRDPARRGSWLYRAAVLQFGTEAEFFRWRFRWVFLWVGNRFVVVVIFDGDFVGVKRRVGTGRCSEAACGRVGRLERGVDEVAVI